MAINQVISNAVVTDGVPYLGIGPDFTGAYGFPTHPWSVFFQVCGAILVFAAFVPAVIQVLKTKRTESLSVMMWIVAITGLALLAVFAWLGVSVSPGGFILVALSETLSCAASIIVLIVKLINKGKAKKAGMTELEYNNIHFPVKQ